MLSTVGQPSAARQAVPRGRRTIVLGTVGQPSAVPLYEIASSPPLQSGRRPADALVQGPEAETGKSDASIASMKETSSALSQRL